MPRQASVHAGVYKLEPSPVKDKTGGAAWLGPLEHAALSALHKLGLRRFFVKDVADALRVDRRRAFDCVKRLARRGILRKVARGYYELVDESAIDLAVRRLPFGAGSQGQTEGTGWLLFGTGSSASRGGGGGSPASRSRGVAFEGVFYDNVMWYDPSSRFRRTGRGTLLDFLPERVVYAEFTALVRGLSVDGVIVIYSSEEDPQPSVRVEWRPPRGFIKKNDFVSARRMFWEQLLVGLRALHTVLLDEKAPPWIRRRAGAGVARGSTLLRSLLSSSTPAPATGVLPDLLCTE